MEKKEFGRLPDGTAAYLYTLRNDKGAVMTVTDYGAAINTLLVPGKDGLVDVVLDGADMIKPIEE